MKLTQIEGKSPHKKGSAKYKKHMAAKHASMGEKVEAMKGLVERAKHVKANSKKPKLGKPSKGHQSPHPYHKTPNFVGGESAELNENPLAGGLAIVLRGLAGQGWKYGAQAGARGAAKFTGTKMGQRAAQKVGADTIKKVGVAGGKIAGGTAGLAADAYLLDKLVDQFGENEVTNALRQAQGGKQQMFTDMLNKAVQTGVVSTDELDAAMGMYENLDEVSDKMKVAALTGAFALGSLGLGNKIMNMHQGALDHSIQLPQLEMYLDYAESQNDQRMIKQLKTRIRNHKGRLTDMGDLNGPDGTPMSFEVVYDKENPNFDPLGDPLELNKKFAKARDAKNEAKQPNPVAKHSRNKSGAGAHKSAKDYDRKKEKQDLKKMKFDEGMSASKSMLINSVLKDLQKKAQEGGDDKEGLKFLRKLASLVDKKVIVRDNGSLMLENKIPFTQCPKCGGDIVSESDLLEAKKKKKAKKDACYHKVKSRYKVWPSAYASGALVQCRKKGAKNWGNKSKKK